MKKRYVILAGILAVTAFAAGCGRKNKESGSTQEAQVTVAPTQEAASSADSSDKLVNMQKTTPSPAETIANVIGEKTATASSVAILNKTGSEISEFEIRPYQKPSEDNGLWGDTLVQGSFTLQDGQKALYYYEKDARYENGNPVSKYDIRITFTDENKSQWIFRNLPFPMIKEVTLLGEDTADMGMVPYAKYTSGGKEVSTLDMAKKIVSGQYDDSSDSTGGSTSYLTPTPAADNSYNNNNNNDNNTEPAPEPTQPPYQEPEDPYIPEEPDPAAQSAEQYIGQSLDSLKAAFGEPTNGSNYEDEPETGETGYHYYDTFTVSTTVDENGNEVVAGVW